MNIEYLESFLETVRQKSMAKASERLQISHPALSKQIRSLESYYGVTLLKRSFLGVELTVEGQMLFERIQPVLAELKAIKSDLTNLRGIKKITLGTLPSLAANYLPGKVLALEKQLVEVIVNVRNTSHELYELLKNGAIDAAVLEYHPIHVSFWNAVLFDEPYYAVVHANHRFFNRSNVSIEELSTEPLILNPPDCSIRRSITQWMAERDLKPYIKAEVNFGDYILGYVATGAGITIVPQVVSEHIGNPYLKSILIEGGCMKRTISLVAVKEEIGKFLHRYFR